MPLSLPGPCVLRGDKDRHAHSGSSIQSPAPRAHDLGWPNRQDIAHPCLALFLAQAQSEGLWGAPGLEGMQRPASCGLAHTSGTVTRLFGKCPREAGLGSPVQALAGPDAGALSDGASTWPPPETPALHPSQVRQRPCPLTGSATKGPQHPCPSCPIPIHPPNMVQRKTRRLDGTSGHLRPLSSSGLLKPP